MSNSELKESSSPSPRPPADQCYEKYRNSLLLFLGEGNFSFSTSIATLLSSLNCCLIATDYIPELKTELETFDASGESGESKKHMEDKATALLKHNVSTLKSRGHQLFFDVDATKFHEHDEILKAAKNFSNIFIIFNFPHVKSKKMKIGLNRDLLRDFFISCDNFLHSLSNDGISTELTITPIVSLCAGQSGIPEVDVKDRCWGDSWQINDMAAHGNFVCTEICNFENWDLFVLSSSHPENDQTYQSSYYRLQNAVSFTTKGALTFTYQHRQHVNPSNADRLKAILKFSSSTAQNQSDKVLKDFYENFDKDCIIYEGVTCTSQNFQDFMKTCSEQYPLKSYHHILKLENNSVSIKQISSYLNDDSLEVMKFEGKKICVKFAKDPSRLPVTVGNITEECTTLYMDYLLTLKYNCEYRLAMSNSFSSEKGQSLYPHTHEFHISFWLNEKFTMDSLMEVLLNVYGLMLKSLEFVEEYLNISQGRKSTCWRIQVQSLDLPLSRVTAHQLYLKLRQELADRLDLEVR